MFLAQFGEAGAYDFMKVCNFPLSLTAFAWFTSLPACSIGSWAELEEKFHSHFYTGVYKTRLSHLASVRQSRDESVLDFVKRFREIKNRCFHLMISERDLTDLCFAGLRLGIRDKLEHYEFVNVNKLLQRAVSAESCLKESRETYKSNRHNVHVVDDHFDCSDDDNKEICPTEIKWPAENKMVTCPSLKPIHKNLGEEMKFTFDFSKCDRIFDELLKFGYIRINYTLSSADELKRRAYCKYHNSFSHATNDCNVFRWQVQSALNEGRLSLSDMQVDKVPFPMHAIEAGPPAVLIRPKQADTTQGKNVLIGEPRVASNVEMNSGRKVVLGKNDEGKNKLKITTGSMQYLRRQWWYKTVAAQQRPARPTRVVGQANSTQQQG
jgi:hypothetical protein